jgi:hypothetical protein
MPAEYTIDSQHNIVRTNFHGVITPRDISNLASSLAKDPRFLPDYAELAVFETDCNLQLSFLDFRALSNVDPFSSTSKRALVVRSHSLYGQARMFQTARDDDRNVRILDRVEDALNWLTEREHGVS